MQPNRVTSLYKRISATFHHAVKLAELAQINLQGIMMTKILRKNSAALPSPYVIFVKASENRLAYVLSS